MSVLCRSLDSMITSPPLPPSPPEGPPRGTNFSRRKATQPFPPSPALTRILASSMNMELQPRIHADEHRLIKKLIVLDAHAACGIPSSASGTDKQNQSR